MGDHGCEYMTGGTAYVLDESKFESLCNPMLIVVAPLTAEDEVLVRELIYHHLEATDSARAHEVLGAWPTFAKSFRKVRPRPPAAKPAEAKPPASTEAVITENVVAVQQP